MKAFFRTFFACLLAIIISFAVVAVLFMGVAAGLAALGKKQKDVLVKDNSILWVTLSQEVTDKRPDDPFSYIDFEGGKNRPLELNEILTAVRAAKEDDKIKGIFLDLSRLQMGLATMQEVRSALEDFKTSGKWIKSYAEVYSQGAYYLATVADEILLHPTGDLYLAGLRAEMMFFKGTLEKLGVKMNIFKGRDNRYKSALEPFERESLSDANREQYQRLLDNIWDHMVATISKSRNLDVATINVWADSISIRNAQQALEKGLVDNLMYRDELLADLRSTLDIGEKDDIQSVLLPKYARKKKNKFNKKHKNKVGLIYAQGGIQSGNGDYDESIQSGETSKMIRKARLDSSIKAIVFRVNSPGGSAQASEVIWREVQLAAKEKPVIVSMGNVAASGGYYISCAASKILAEPGTITGSIGVFGAIPQTDAFWKEKVGATFDRVKTNALSDIGSPARAMKASEIRLIQASVDAIYDTFLVRVANGRSMDLAAAEKLAKGRVWTGDDALAAGLVDTLGGLQDAITLAANMAGLDEYHVKKIQKEEEQWMKIIRELTEDAKAWALGDDYNLLQEIKYIQSLSEMKGVQALWPYRLTIE